MRKSTKGCITVILFLCAIILIIVGLVLSTKQILYNNLIERIRSEKLLVDNTKSYEIWSSPKKMTLAINFFHVENPEDVLQGELPKLMERGPYIYDIIIEREILSVNEIQDEIIFNLKKTYYYNEEKSGELSENDEIVIINMPYLSAINTLASFSLSLLKQYGVVVEKLFPDNNPLFVKAKVKDLLFDGIPLFCDITKHVKMKLICMTLKGKKPPILWDTDIDNHYMYSVFGTKNGTWFGPITINRGVRDPTLLGGITSIKNERVQKYWNSEECNTIRGQGDLIFPSYDEPPQRIYFYIEDLCRSIFVKYQKIEKFEGTLDVWRYSSSIENWSHNESDCYCPISKKEKRCPPTGLINADKCAKIPIFISEPHFLNADPVVLEYVPDLHPSEELHSSFLLIDPLSNNPFEGYRKSQVNMKITSYPIGLLANVTDGYFPIIWISEGARQSGTNIEILFMLYKYRRLVLIIQWLPAAIGVFLLLLILICYKLPTSRKRVQSIDPTATINSNFVSSNVQGLEYLPRERHVRFCYK